jgi:hypothetical protein
MPMMRSVTAGTSDATVFTAGAVDGGFALLEPFLHPTIDAIASRMIFVRDPRR